MSQSQSLYRQQISIMERFDFERVHKCMKALNWKWRGEEPTIDDLKVKAEVLLTTATNRIHDEFFNQEGTWFSVSTGGFKASMHMIGGDWRLMLEFIVEDEQGQL